MNATTLFLFMLLAVPIAAAPAEACGDYLEYFRLDELSEQVLSEDANETAKAVEQLRAAGPSGLYALLGRYHEHLTTATPATPLLLIRQPSERDQRIRSAIDKVAGQKDAHVSRLFWHTDLDAARAAAKETGRGILSLRLLGRLDEDLSCANSRFFRTALYANKEIATYLMRNFVLHWKSVRPVPVITIDFGDGRKICRTITGNSIHYVLDREGQPVEAIPGLYGPKAFLEQLQGAQRLLAALNGIEKDADRATHLSNWHASKGHLSDAAWTADLEQIGLPMTPRHAPSGSTAAGDAALRATGKARLELPVLKVLRLEPAAALRAHTSDEAWAKIAALHADEARLDESSASLFRSKGPAASVAMPLTVSKMVVEDPMLRAMRNFERSMAEDTVRNEYDFHRILHRWFAEGGVGGVDELNERVYAQIFRTPSSDPWLGLVPVGRYAALDGGGIVSASAR